MLKGKERIKHRLRYYLREHAKLENRCEHHLRELAQLKYAYQHHQKELAPLVLNQKLHRIKPYKNILFHLLNFLSISIATYVEMNTLKILIKAIISSLTTRKYSFLYLTVFLQYSIVATVLVPLASCTNTHKLNFY